MKMTRQNPFNKKGVYAKFVNSAYDRLMERKWFTTTDVAIGAKYEIPPAGVSQITDYSQRLKKDVNVYKELKVAFHDVRTAICLKLGEKSIKAEGKTRNKTYLYIGEDNDPLADMKNARAVKDLKEYVEFCQDMASIFPTSWLEDFFHNDINQLNIKDKKQNGKNIISASIDHELANIGLVPLLYSAIKEKFILNIEYKKSYTEFETVEFHPNHLKEYNGRWFLLGYAAGKEYGFGYNIPLDRINGIPTIKDNQKENEYKTAPAGFYEEFFKNIVGVSHQKRHTPIDIHIRAYTCYMFNLMDTKRIHHSHKVTIPFGQHEDGEYGEFTVYVETNNEFFGRILQMGADLEIVSPESVRNEFKQRVKALANLYKDMT